MEQVKIDDVLNSLIWLKELAEMGILTFEEFTQQKEGLLGLI